MQTEIEALLQPIDSGGLVDLLQAEPTPTFVRGVPFQRTEEIVKRKMRNGLEEVEVEENIVTLRRSLYGEILSRRGVPDELLEKMSDEEAREAAFKKVRGFSIFDGILLDEIYRGTPVTRPELITGRFGASSEDPRQVLGQNARMVIAFGTAAEWLKPANAPSVDRINLRDPETARAYTAIIGKANYLHSSEYSPLEYARNSVTQAYSRFGPEVAQVTGLVAMELQGFSYPLEGIVDSIGRHSEESSKIGHTMEFIDKKAAQTALKKLYFMNKMKFPKKIGAELRRQLIAAHQIQEPATRQFYVFVDKPVKK